MSKWNAQCSTCEYYNSSAGASNCLRYPPQVVVVPNAPNEIYAYQPVYKMLSQFPDVQPDDICGEYQPERKKFREHIQQLKD